MKQKLFTLLLAVAASVGTMFAWDYERVPIGNLYYNLDATNQTAEVTSQNSDYPYWSTTITTANIPASVTYNSVSYSVTSIGSYAFYGCEGLTSVTIPNSVTSIGNQAFRNCTGLTSVTIPNSVTSIGYEAFYKCTGLTSVIVENGNTIYDSRDNCNAIIETATNTLIVGCKNTIIPNSVTSIGYAAFGDCTGLTSIEIPNSVTSIGGGAFYGCTGLTSITIPNSVTSIGYNAFSGCSGLTSVTIPNSVTSIGNNAFSNVPNIIYNGTATGSPWGARSLNGYVEGWLVYSDDTKTTLSGCSTSATGEISIPNSVTSIGDYAFRNCSSLTSVTIPNSVTSIGDDAFYGCTGLTSVTIGNSVTSIGGGAFAGCTGLTSVTIPNSVTNIGSSAFNSCRGLTSVTIGNSVTSIGSSTFYNCTGLTSITIPNSVTSIEDDYDGKRYIYPAFYGCNGITSVIWNARNCNGYNFGSQVESFVFGNEVEVIPDNICSGMNKLASIIIPNSVTSIGSSAFSGCSGVASIDIPNSVTSIGNKAFDGCTGITSVIWNARNCNGYNFGSQVESFVFGNEVEVIPDNICSGMNKLTSIIIPNSVTSIGYRAFYGCTGLTSVTIPNSVTSIGGGAFAGCTGLTSVTIPNSVTNIGSQAFQGCTGITSVETPAIFFNDAYSIFGLSLSEMPSHIKHITIKGGELTSEGLDRIRVSYRELEMIDLANATNTELPDVALNGCYKLQTLFLPQNLKRIGYMAVADCKNLQSIDIPASVTEISQSAFENCRSLKTITFGGQASSAPGRFGNASSSQLQTIGNWAFYNCHELQNLEIPEGVTYIGDGAFYGCVYLEGLSLPSSVQSIGDNCFALCSKLQKIIVNAPVPPSIQAKTFYDVNRQIPVYVPDESVNAYKNDAQWSEFNIQGISNVPLAIDQINSSSLQGGDRGRLILRDGQVFILRGKKVYTTTGQEVK